MKCYYCRNLTEASARIDYPQGKVYVCRTHFDEFK